MSAHTPGPWKLEMAGDGFYVIGADGLRVALTCHPSMGATRQSDANGHLISAAPELLVSLEILTAHYCQLIDSGDAGNWDPRKEPQVDQAFKAIAKATGAA